MKKELRPQVRSRRMRLAHRIDAVRTLRADGAGLCIGGVRVDRSVALQILDAVSDRAVEAAIVASDQVERSQKGSSGNSRVRDMRLPSPVGDTSW
jgi:hypothetical protein